MASSILEEFQKSLQTQWTRPVACQNKCEPNPCLCQRHIVHVDLVREWWLKEMSDNSKRTKLHRLLDELSIPQHRIFPLQYKDIVNGDQSSLLVYSLLLKQGHGHLVDIFTRSDMRDQYIAITRSDSNEILHKDLSTVEPTKAASILAEFHKERWQYCPLRLTLDMNHTLYGTNVILPFCHKIQLGDKGGTASIYMVAVQKDLIQDDSLRLAISDSRYTDPIFGECYQMILKTYRGNKKKVYELEKEAFSALSQVKDVPIIRYLGCYEHDYGEGRENGRTFNLLLECGEGGDLLQSWADETNVPPVRADEIIRFWESLFKVADAIRHIHDLEYSRHGKGAAPLKYVGWHADIKPDNILIVNKCLKLADFGYSRFAPVAAGQNHVPTEIIQGFTDTYGAPEVSRMKDPRGTLTGVTRSIDTWSFGCVLSVAATWVVLGYQGIRQFDRLRQLAASNKIQGKIYDRFHDGKEVLPEIRHWHNYLRGHLRPSDTATEQVLSLIEVHMLQTEYANRIESGELCVKLRKIVQHAKNDVHDLKANSQTTDPVVLRALLSIERSAHVQNSDRRKTAPIVQQSINPTMELNINPLPRASARTDKKEFYETKRLGQTPYRKDILENNLLLKVETDIGNANLQGHSRHNGGLTDSPTHDINLGREPNTAQTPNQGPFSSVNHPLELMRVNGWSNTAISSPDAPAGPHESAIAEQHPRNEIDAHVHFSDSPTNSTAPWRPTSDDKQTGNSTAQRDIGLPSQQPHISTLEAPTYTSINTAKLSFEIEGLPAGTPTYSPRFISPPRNSPHSIPGESPIISRVSPVQGSLSERATQSPQISLSPPHPFKPYPEHAQGLAYNESVVPPHRQNLSYAENVVGPNSMNIHPVSNRQDTHDAYTEKQTVEPEPMHESAQLTTTMPLPISVYNINYDICRVRKLLEEEAPKGKRASFMNMMKERKADKDLANTYRAREIVFIVDNGASMFDHWPILFFTAETLVRKTAGLDKNGIDLVFTNEGHRHNKSGLKKDQGRRIFHEALIAAAPERVGGDKYQADMHTVFSNIATEWRKNGHRPTTLIVFTDGVWKQTHMNLVNDTILKIAGGFGSTGKRSFSIQFIRFGEAGKERLEELDNDLCRSRDLKDIVDHCSWRSSVEKMLKGSIDAQHDEDDSDDPDIPYEYTQLMTLFRNYNEHSYEESFQSSSRALLAPVQARPDLSRSSSRSSNASHPNPNRVSAPPPQSESWRTHSRPPFSA